MSQVDASPSTRPAGLFRRLAAMFYDSLLLVSVLFLATLAVLPLTGGEAIVDNALYDAYITLVLFLYFAWHWVHKGQTLGMKAWHLRVVQEDHQPLTWWHALLRFMLAIVSLAPLGLGLWWVWVDREKMAWHDRASGTRIVVDSPRRSRG